MMVVGFDEGWVEGLYICVHVLKVTNYLLFYGFDFIEGSGHLC